RERLPQLAGNLRHGHSLLDGDWKGSGAPPLVWTRDFPEIFQEGGFDVVIGNPPYLSFGGRHAVEITAELRRYYAEHYESGGWPTAHSLFLERAVKLLSRRFVSFVVPDQVGHLAGYRSARAIAQREAGVVEVRYWGERVFRGVTTPALTIVLDKEKKGTLTELVDRDGASSQANFESGEPWTSSPARALIDRLRERSFSLEKLVGDCGIRTTAAKAQVVDWPGPAGSVVPVLEGKLVGRYGCRPPSSAVRLDSKEPLFISKKERYEAVRFVIRQTASYPIVGPREHAVYFRNSLLALFSPSGDVDVHYLVALLNSRLLRFVYTETVREAQQRTFPQVKVKALQSLPFREVRTGDRADKMRHDALVDLARAALDAQKRIFAARGTEDEAKSASEFERIDSAIDEAVYDLYDLSASDRNMVEQGLARAAL
ncbi:MAG: TaqI-like C-terminal specificity domain-containing protein, partial [Polyangiaceae bacterium]